MTIEGAPAVRVIADKERDKLADEVMDYVAAADGASTAHTPRSQLDEDERAERSFMAQFQTALTEQLSGQGIRCHTVHREAEGNGYRAVCYDRSGRRYEADITYDEGIEAVYIAGENAGRRLIELACDRILNARRTWFRRMGVEAPNN